MADSEDDDELYAGVARPMLGGAGVSSAAPASDDSDDDDDDDAAAAEGPTADDEPASGLLGADAAFEVVDGTAYDLDPFRVAGPKQAAEAGPSSAAGAAASQSVGKPCSKLFIGGLAHEIDDAALLKAFARYGKVQEASVVRAEGGKSRGFGFVTYVHQKGANYCIQQLGDPPQLELGGRTSHVRYAEQRGGEIAHFRMPARGQYDPKPKRSAVQHKAPGGPPDLVAPKRALDEAGAELLAGGEFEGGDGFGGAGGKKKRGKKKKEEIVTVSKRQDAEPLYDKKLTMKELFPKEFWRL